MEGFLFVTYCDRAFNIKAILAGVTSKMNNESSWVIKFN